MLRRVLAVCCLICCVLLTLVGEVGARTWIVCKDIDLCPIRTIQAGIDSAASGDTVMVRLWGNYYENLVIEGKDIVLTHESGSGDASVIVNNTQPALLVRNCSPEVSNLEFVNTHALAGGGIYVRAEDGQPHTPAFTNCTIRGGYIGFYVNPGTNTQINNCTIRDNSFKGLRAANGAQVTLSNSWVYQGTPPGMPSEDYADLSFDGESDIIDGGGNRVGNPAGLLASAQQDSLHIFVENNNSSLVVDVSDFCWKTQDGGCPDPSQFIGEVVLFPMKVGPNCVLKETPDDCGWPSAGIAPRDEGAPTWSAIKSMYR